MTPPLPWLWAVETAQGRCFWDRSTHGTPWNPWKSRKSPRIGIICCPPDGWILEIVYIICVFYVPAKKETMLENIHSGGQALRSPVSNMSRCLSVGWKKWSRVAHLQIRWVPTWKEHLKVTQKQIKSKTHLKSIPNTIQFDTKAIEKQIDLSLQWGETRKIHGGSEVGIPKRKDP